MSIYEPLTHPPALRPEGNGSSFLAGLIFTLAVTALISWVTTVALDRGFGVHVSFVASWVLLTAGLQVVKLAAIEVAHSWHRAAAKVAPVAAAAAVKAANEAAREYGNE